MKHTIVTAVNRLLSAVGYRAVRHPRSLHGDPSRELLFSLLHSIGALRLRKTDEDATFRFLQIGALEMPGHIELVAIARKFADYRGVLVDAQSIAIDRLRQKYGDDRRIDVVHAVITAEGKDMPFYHVDNSGGRFPSWVEGLASLNKASIQKFRSQVPGIEDGIVETVVKGDTIRSVLESRGVETLDVFMVDAEGHDFELLKQFPFERIRPQIVFLEHSHLSAEDREAAVDLLVRHRYRVAVLHDDILAESDTWKPLS